MLIDGDDAETADDLQQRASRWRFVDGLHVSTGWNSAGWNWPEVSQYFQQDGSGWRRIMSWVWSSLDQIWALTLSHMLLSAIPVVVGFILSVPLGWLASRYRIARSILLSVGGILYTIPSLALFVLLPLVIGTGILDPTNVVVALTIYAVAIMIRSAADAFASVPVEVQDSATGVGYSRLQRILTVDLPLAGPVLLAGVRVVSVSTVSLVTVGSVIGVSTLGNLFLDGFQRFFLEEIITGIVAVLVVAIVFDGVLVLLGRLLMPWNSRINPRRARRVVAGQAQGVSP